MRKPGRKSIAEMSVAPIDVRHVRVEPRADAPDDVQAIVRELVGMCPAEHFRPSDYPLLESYANAILMERQAQQALALEGPIAADGKPSGWILIGEKAAKQIVAVSARLRLSPQHRTDPKTTGRNDGPRLRRPWEDSSR